VSIVETEQGVGLLWGLRDSFLSYARRVGARVELGGGAGLVADGDAFYFPLADQSGFEVTALSGVLRFDGRVRILAHHGALDVRVVAPFLTVSPGLGVLSARTRSGEGARRFDLVEADLPVPTCDGSTLMWSACETVLSSGGVGLFQARYGAGEPFAPIAARIHWPESQPVVAG